ncbi:ABC transporter substrate-binding protein [Paenibacillus sp. MMS20-IR301]|uniref:ABC transporter substrate-binding protein n=1 Tax=Paenibacillus sp. MMS20-IR301 TaxID=2895946 RepID=UPI0028EA327F|nr:ABC transporter substrate-binding protein [Paenibacillus sp. MMS20-IR301]WNS44208.1 ABC transporter substrate-binding protein [Paenibacillus sp. MMS20-IR301]
MPSTKKFLLPLTLLLFTLILASCGQANNRNNAAPAATAAATVVPAASPAASEPAAATTRMYTDYKNREVEIPTEPQTIVYVGSNPGDLLALGVKPAGATLSVIGTQVAYPDLLEGIEDVGYPFSPEKILSLSPDLIIFDDWDETGIEALSQIAPTVVVGLDGTFPTEERVRQLAELFGRTAEADTWFSNYKAKVASVKAQLNLTEGESAASLLVLGSDLYVMGGKGLNETLYGQLGFTPTAGVQKLIDADERFASISDEVLPEYMGTHLFLLTDTSTETAARQATLMNSGLWKAIPAVKEGRVYTFDSKYNFDDPVTLDRLLDEIATIFNSQVSK